MDICSPIEDFMKAGSILVRYGISTLGLVVVAVGVGLSVKSNLGISPPSCPPVILNLVFPTMSVGAFTWMMHLVLIGLQAILLRREFKLRYLMQIPAAFVFGYLCDLFIWLFDAIGAPATDYLIQMALCLVSIVVTAIGIGLEVVGDGWILAGDKTVDVLAHVAKKPFGHMKVIVDVVFVAATALVSYLAFGLLSGNGTTFVIREGTLILAILTGLCMRLTDPLLQKYLGRFVKKYV